MTKFLATRDGRFGGTHLVEELMLLGSLLSGNPIVQYIGNPTH